MNIAYNPLNNTLTSDEIKSAANDLLFDLHTLSIYAKGVQFKGTDTTYNIFNKNNAGLVPAPSELEANTRYLREDGTWQIVSGNKVQLLETTNDEYKPVILGYTTITNNVLSKKDITDITYVNSKLSYNASKGILKTNTFKGNLLGNAESVNNYKISVGSEVGSDTNTIYFII